MSTFIWPPVSVTTLPPLGGATSANQVLEIAELTAINANTAGPVKIRKNGTVQEVTKDTTTPANTVAIPVEIVSASGTTINITAGDINIQTSSEGSNFDSMRIGSGSGFFAEVTSNNDLSTFDSLSFTELVEINQQTMNVDLKTPSLGQATEAASSPVVLPLTQISALTAGFSRSFVQTLFFNYATTSVTSLAWVQLIASTSDVIKYLTYFESGGYPMEIGIGAAAAEVRLFVVPPGGFNGEIPFPIPSGSRVSIRCLQASDPDGNPLVVNFGQIVANFLK